jgi:hypothetical protein
LRTITSGRYTTEHWRSGGPALAAAQHRIREMRLKLLEQAKAELGLSGPVM